MIQSLGDKVWRGLRMITEVCFMEMTVNAAEVGDARLMSSRVGNLYNGCNAD